MRWLVVVFVAACGTLDLPDGIACGDGESCPRGTSCGPDGVCHEDPGGGDDDAAGGDGSVTCPGGRMADFTDNFDDLSAWTVVGAGNPACSVTTTGGVLVIMTSDQEDCGVESTKVYGFVDQSAALRFADDMDNDGNPDVVFRVYAGNKEVRFVMLDSIMYAEGCPNGINCGSTNNDVDLPDWWRLRHDSTDQRVHAETSQTGTGFADFGSSSVSSEEAACAQLFIGTRGLGTAGTPLPIRVDRLNIL